MADSPFESVSILEKVVRDIIRMKKVSIIIVVISTLRFYALDRLFNPDLPPTLFYRILCMLELVRKKVVHRIRQKRTIDESRHRNNWKIC